MEPDDGPQISAVTFEHHPTGLGLAHPTPRLSWRFTSPGPSWNGWEQRAYDIQVTLSSSTESKTYHVESTESVLVPWPTQDLHSRDIATVRVRAFGRINNGDGKIQDTAPTLWSTPVKVEAALLEREDWSAQLVTSQYLNGEDNEAPLRPIRFRKGFSLPNDSGDIAKARLYITSLGVYEAYINGSRVGEHVLAPGWQSYNHRLNYQIFDVTSLLDTVKDNIIGVEVAEGWYAGRLGFFSRRRCYGGSELAVLAQLEVSFEGETQSLWTLSSDETWKCGKSAILRSEFYDGEVYDMREEKRGWDSEAENFDDSSFSYVKLLPFPRARLVASDAPPVAITERVSPVDIFATKSGKTVLDFGQNLVGVLHVTSLQIAFGHQISFTHAEVLEDGEIATRPLRNAKCTDTILFSGGELLGWSPKFTFHGFRYVQIDGWPTAPKELPSKSIFTALVIHTDMRRRGWFSCSEPLINKLHDNVVWSMRGNFLSIPTDCPQRDERLGWTGDIQVFTPSASFLYDTTGMLSGWLEDVAVEQLHKESGIPGLVVPDILPESWKTVPQALWHDITALMPWDLYLFTNDKEILRRQYQSMKTWIDKGIHRGLDQLWDPSIWQLGDWLDPNAPPDDPGNGRTDGVLIADAYLVHVTEIMASICAVLDLPQDAREYASDAASLKKTFQNKYITPVGNIMCNTQTAISLAVHFKLFDEAGQLTTAANSLSRLVRGSGFHISTGFAGTPIICHALTATGQPELAYRMMLETTFPSWLYPVTMGATTVWERWNSMLPDGSINPGEMTSFNHYALGSVVNWLHTTVGGISPLNAGWRTIRVRPIPGGTIHAADIAFESPYGRVSCSWKLAHGVFVMSLLVPPSSKAQVTLPGMQLHESEILVGSGLHHFSCLVERKEWPPRPLPASWMRVEADGNENGRNSE